MPRGLLMLAAQMAADKYSDIRWHAYCRATIAGTLGATSRLIVFSLSTYINKYIYIYVCVYVYMHGSDKSLVFTLSTHINIYIYIYVYAWRRQVTCILSLHIYVCIYMSAIHTFYKYICVTIVYMLQLYIYIHRTILFMFT